jgi:hypothetical protein
MTGATSRPAVVKGDKPVSDVGGDGRGQGREPGFHQGVEGWDSVVVEKICHLQDLGGTGPTEVTGPQR